MKCILDTGLRFNAIAFRGWSGALIAPDLAFRLNVGLVGVRKDYDQEPAHGAPVEGNLKISLNYIIVDDFIGSGKTIEEIIKGIAQAAVNQNELWEYDILGKPKFPRLSVTHKCVGIFLHRAASYDYGIDQPYQKIKHEVWLDSGEFLELPTFNCWNPSLL